MTAQFIPVEPFDLIVFGGTGDLALRKLLPGLYHRDHNSQLQSESRIIAVARSELDQEAYAQRVVEALRRFIKDDELDDEHLRAFTSRLHYVRLDASSDSGWDKLAELLGDAPDRIRVFYLATSPDLFGPVCRRIGDNGMITPMTRVVIEKPIGRDIESARAINDEVGSVFREEQIFRIDHYLGKETVQNLMALRFANSLFEPIWDRSSIDHVQITVAETVGVEGRAAYYDKSGALRDMIQNHMLQLLCIVAMEPPSALKADAVRDEKLKVLRSLVPITDGLVQTQTVRGHYSAGAIDGKPVPGYLEELGGQQSSTETFVALKAEVANWRWAGVPFYLRTGKRMATRASEIVIQFRSVPHSIFGGTGTEMVSNRLVLRLQPDESVKLFLMTKDPGPGGLRLKNVPLNLTYASAFSMRYPDAYERLLMDVVRGNQTLFMRKDEVEAAWQWTDPILDAWASLNVKPRPYTAGSWGPSDAYLLIARDGRVWYEEVG